MKKKNIVIIVLLVLLVSLVVGVTYAFFNYTRTGSANTISVGRIYFHTNQAGTISLTNIFPVASSSVVSNSSNTVTVDIEGDTTYSGGIEYLVSIDEVNNTINNKQVPISFKATQSSLGTGSNTYWTSRGGNTAIFELTSEGVASEGKYVMVGYIPAGAEGVDGSVSITAYLDTTKVAITDTVENGPIEVNGYDNGTDTNWIDGRTVITADEWNSFATTPLSFKVRVEANEGIWVQKEGTIESCPNCKFMYIESDLYTTWNKYGDPPTEVTSGYSEDYRDIVASSGKNYFFGVITNGSNYVTRAFACGVKDTVPFCIEGTPDASKYTDNATLLQSSNLYNNTCTLDGDYLECGPWDNSSSLSADISSDGFVETGSGGGNVCYVDYDGIFECVSN